MHLGKTVQPVSVYSNLNERAEHWRLLVFLPLGIPISR